MITKIQIISPRPLRKNVFVFNENKSIKGHNSKFISTGIIASSPLTLKCCTQESPKFFDDKSSIQFNICSDNIKNSSRNCSPIHISPVEEDFKDFKNNLRIHLEEDDAKSEILSILSTDQNDSVSSRHSIRSSMPPIRPVNPLLKTLNLENSPAGALSDNFWEFSFSNINKSVHKLDVNTK